MNPLHYLDEIGEAIDFELHKATDPIAKTELDIPYNYFVKNGGKRLRPKLTILAAAAVGVSIEDSLRNAIAIELLHNFTLIHDDIMDASEMRRGRKTIHIKWDTPTAVLLGDMIMGMAYRYLKGNEKVHSAFSKALFDVCYGQALDIKFNKDQSVSVHDYFEMISNKTSSLLVASVEIGSRLGHDDHTSISLAKYAENLGLAFQLKDDLLDLTADSAELGKTIGQDIIEGKKTYMILRTKELVHSTGNRHGIDLINEFYIQNGLPKSKISEITHLMYELGVIKDTKTRIEDFTKHALENLESIPNNDTKNCLIWLTNYLLERNS